MSSASYDDLASSTKHHADSIDVGKTAPGGVGKTAPGGVGKTAPAALGKTTPAGVGRRRLVFLLTLAAAAEFLVLTVTAYFATLFYHGVDMLSSHDSARYIQESLLISTFGLLISLRHGQYSKIQTQPRHVFLWNGVSSVFFVFLFLVLTMFLLKTSEDYSRGAVMIQAVSVGLAVLFIRAIWFSILQRAIASGFVNVRRVILIGDADRCLHFSGRAMAKGIRTIRSFDFPSVRDRPVADQALPDARQLVADCRRLRADDIIILISQQDVSPALTLASALSDLPVDVHVLPAGFSDLIAVSRIAHLGDMTTMQVFQSPLTPFNLAIKRAFDITAALGGLVLLSPLFVVAALAIKVDSRGPVLFRQTRHGYNNEPIRVLKFRSMTVMEDGADFRPAIRHDPRVTRLGRFLRRTNIDELPQLFNVLVGDMSLVGPRPHATAHNEAFDELISSFYRRHNVKPGITGWAQVNGHRGATDTLEKMRRRVELDLHYIDNWSFLLDLKIIVTTLFSRQVYMDAY